MASDKNRNRDLTAPLDFISRLAVLAASPRAGGYARGRQKRVRAEKYIHRRVTFRVFHASIW